MSSERFTVRSALGRVRGLGSARSGTSHWLWQRLTGLIMVPLSFWFISSLLTTLHDGSIESVHAFFLSSFNALTFVVLLIALFYHAMLGIQVVLEDYVHSAKLLFSLVVLNKFAMTVLALVSVLAVLKLHLYGIHP